MHVWRVNRRSYAYQAYSRVIESLAGIDSPLEDPKATILANLPLPAIEKFILFGSVAKQEERHDINPGRIADSARRSWL